MISTCGTGPADVVTTLRGFQLVGITRGVIVLNSVGRLKRADRRRRRGVTSCLSRYGFSQMLLTKRRFNGIVPSFRRFGSIITLGRSLRECGPGKCCVLVGNSGDVGLDRLRRVL